MHRVCTLSVSGGRGQSYNMTTMLHSSSTNPALLLTPNVNLHSPTCIHLHISLSGADLRLRILRYDGEREDGEKTTVLTVIEAFEIYDKRLSIIKVDLPMGLYKVLIEANGERSSISISKVILSSYACSSAGKYVFIMASARIRVIMVYNTLIY